MKLESVTLVDSMLRLEPLSPAHVAPLWAAADEEQSLYGWSFVPGTFDEMQAYVDAALSGQNEGNTLPFAIVRLSDNEVVGCSRFYDVERWPWLPKHAHHDRKTPDAAEIGYTWLARSAIRTGVNTRSKRLLLRFAFEQWRVHRISFRTDVRNARSRAAIERIGAKLDGVLRGERPGSDGTVRDSAVYSITAAEWPDVKRHLDGLAGSAE